MARTAVVAGTATAVSNRVSRRQANRWAQQGSYGYGEQPPPDPYYAQQPPPPPQAPPPARQEDVIDQLRELGKLREQGVLTDDEFAAQKAKLLAS